MIKIETIPLTKHYQTPVGYVRRFMEHNSGYDLFLFTWVPCCLMITGFNLFVE